MRIVGGSFNVSFIEVVDGELVTVVPDEQRPLVEQALSKPIDVWRSVEDEEQGRIDEVLTVLEPGSDEHVARAILALPGGLLLEGDEAIPAEEDAAVPDAI